VDTTSEQLLAGANALGMIDHADVPTDVRDLARAGAGYARLVVARLTAPGPLDARDVDDLLHLGEIVAQHAALTDAAGDGRPAIRLAAASVRWLVFAAQLPLVEFPVGASAIETAVTEATRRARLAAVAPDTAPQLTTAGTL
jgi:hypothetical protein